MRSHAERARVVAELLLRGVALAAMAILLWRAFRPATVAQSAVATRDIGAALATWTSSAPPDAHVVLDAVPDPLTRDWMRALAHAGTALHWSASRPLTPSAMVAEPAADPYGATRVRLASHAGEPVALIDAAGMIDTLPEGGNAEFELGVVAGDVRVRGQTFVARTVPRDSVVLRAVLVLGAAGWEPKFTIAALEERGWRVAARLRVAPGVDVTQGALASIDTGRYSAIVVLDSTADPLAGAIARYVRAGGGVILAGSSARTPSLAALAPGGVGRRRAGVAGAVASATPRSGLGAFAVASPRADAVVLEARDATPVIAARRVDAGRVVQVGYDETWRWRMGGGDEAVRAHREWWSRLVSSVAYAPLAPVSAPTNAVADPAPLALLHSALGAPSPLDSAVTQPRDAAAITRVLFLLVVAPLLLEWVSRRLRGAR
ncbi:MAG TPA: hypothetical protein VFZ21_32070 [Gemmatimonadaceae bacterium]|jgi:hypothetical protein|nr:hypothetical protein [Gemmatimonadaceae bacterium]